ncbi:MAG: error-prone DNA polymerase [Phycisphaeraceae bacterium]
MTKHVPHPGKSLGEDDGHVSFAPQAYAELHVTSNFTFLTGASHPEELVQQAAELGYRGMALTDRHSLAGVVRAHARAKACGLPFAVGCRLEMALGSGERSITVLVYPTSRAAYGRLCQLLTLGKRRAPKGECHLTLHDLIEHQTGLLAVLVPPLFGGERVDDLFLEAAQGLCRTFNGDRLSLAVSLNYGPNDRAGLEQSVALADHLRIPLVAVNDVHYHVPQRKPLHDVLACIRQGCTLDQAGYTLSPNAERYLKLPHELHRLFAAYPPALARGVEVLQRAAQFSLAELRYEYPHETCPPGKSAMEHLCALTWAGAADRYPAGLPDKVRAQLEHELDLIAQLNYPHYFLTVHDIVRFARVRGILCQGRGAAANSAVCYCLAVTAVDPARINLLFERFISKERDEPPDIDIDFEHERREEVIQYLYEKYGRHRAALTAEVITYRGRSAVREVGKALGLSLDLVDRLAKDLFWFDKSAADRKRYAELGVDPDDPTIQLLGQLSREILGFPRHLSQHVGGFVLTDQPLSQTVPIENAAMPDRTVIEWDKDDIDALGMLKVDVLGLGMLTAVRKCFELIERHHGRRVEMHTVPPEDPAVYEMISNADTVGVFQIESRAQMSMLPRLRPREFYDLVIEVAIVRPGPIQGGMVHPYLRRRSGEEAVEYPSQAVRQVLEKTLGVPLFQEQAMQLAITAAGFTPGEADQLRRSMAAWKRKGDQIYRFGEKLINGMLANGYPLEFAQRCFEQIKGFSEYGFPESHAASFALIVYVSAWLKHHYPAAFAAALINSQPMGFYAPAQLVRDAKEHGVKVHPIDVQHSAWDCTVECGGLEAALACGQAVERSCASHKAQAASRPPHSKALRLGMRLIKGLKQTDADAIAQACVQHGPFASIEQLWRTSGASARSMRLLAKADAFASLGLDRSHARWTTQRLHDEDLPLFDEEQFMVEADDAGAILPAVAPPMQVVQDYGATGLSLKAHPLSFIRPALEKMNVTCNAELSNGQAWPDGAPMRVAGLVLVRQRPATASGIVFMTMEDETGVANLIVRPRVFDRCRKAARHSSLVIAQGRVERQGQVVHVMVTDLRAAPALNPGPAVRSRDFH